MIEIGTRYSGPGGSYWEDGEWHDRDGTPFPPLPEGMAWFWEEPFSHDFPDPPAFRGDCLFTKQADE